MPGPHRARLRSPAALGLGERVRLQQPALATGATESRRSTHDGSMASVTAHESLVGDHRRTGGQSRARGQRLRRLPWVSGWNCPRHGGASGTMLLNSSRSRRGRGPTRPSSRASLLQLRHAGADGCTSPLAQLRPLVQDERGIVSPPVRSPASTVRDSPNRERPDWHGADWHGAPRAFVNQRVPPGPPDLQEAQLSQLDPRAFAPTLHCCSRAVRRQHALRRGRRCRDGTHGRRGDLVITTIPRAAGRPAPP